MLKLYFQHVENHWILTFGNVGNWCKVLLIESDYFLKCLNLMGGSALQIHNLFEELTGTGTTERQ